MRGQLSIFEEIISDISAGSPAGTEEKKGRNARLHLKRNELLIHRYYWHIRIKQHQYLHTLRLLERDELYLTQRTIIDILQRDKETLRKLHEQRPTLRYFKKKYPNWVW